MTLLEGKKDYPKRRRKMGERSISACGFRAAEDEMLKGSGRMCRMLKGPGRGEKIRSQARSRVVGV